MLIGVTPSGDAFDMVLIMGRPAKLAEALIPRFRADKDSNAKLGIPIRLMRQG